MRNMLPSAIISVLIALGLSVPSAAQDTTDQQLGSVNFETSCNEVAQRRFDRGMRYQHSFWYRAAIEIFEETLKADPTCAIAHWGIALACGTTHTIRRRPPIRRPRWQRSRRQRRSGRRRSVSETYIDALALLYTDYDKTPYRPRLVTYLKAMESLAQRYPRDDEVQIAYAITLQVSALTTDKTYAQQVKGAAILEPISQRLPLHPGVTHYLIHLYDYPELANKGLDAANRYAKIAPDAPHAQHMPSHIYTRVGYWKQSVASNLAAAKAAQAHKESSDLLHARDYMVYAYLQLAQDNKARAVISEMAAVEGVNPAVQAPHFARAASPARYVIERADWSGAMALEAKPSRFPLRMQ